MTDIATSGTTDGVGNTGAADRDQAALALKSSLVDGAHDVSDGVKHLAEDVMGQTRKTAETQVSAGKARAAEGLKSVASALRKTGEHLRQEDQDAFTEYFDQAAQKVDAVSGYLRKRTLPELVTDVEGFARRDPALFIGGALVLGLVGGRFLKSSRPAIGAQASSSPSRPMSPSASERATANATAFDTSEE
jgi:hypothetical protein